MIRKIVFNIHLILGLLLCVLFLMWFLSGFVMIYHSFQEPLKSTNCKDSNRFKVHCRQ